MTLLIQMKPDVEIYFNDLGELHGQYKNELSDATLLAFKDVSNLIEQRVKDLTSLIEQKFKLYSRVIINFIYIVAFFVLHLGFFF
jgi:hypothetical protein